MLEAVTLSDKKRPQNASACRSLSSLRLDFSSLSFFFFFLRKKKKNQPKKKKPSIYLHTYILYRRSSLSPSGPRISFPLIHTITPGSEDGDKYLS